MKKFIADNKIFLSLYLLFAVAGGIVLAAIHKGDEVLWFNSIHSASPDTFFAFAHLCLDIPPKELLFVFFITLFLSYGKGLLYFCNVFCNALAMILIQDHIFYNMPRPADLFAGKVPLHFVEGVIMRSHSGFPSSYTCHAFSLFFMLSIFLSNKKWSYLFFGLAMLAVITRLYLFENFFSDLYFGSLLGMSTTVALNLTLAQSNFYRNIRWKDRALGRDLLGMLKRRRNASMEQK
jgi:hypothetical protein